MDPRLHIANIYTVDSNILATFQIQEHQSHQSMKFWILFAACYMYTQLNWMLQECCTLYCVVSKYGQTSLSLIPKMGVLEWDCICTMTGEDSTITGPMKLRSYYAVASYSDQKSKFSFSEGALLQLLQKDSSGKYALNFVPSRSPTSALSPMNHTFGPSLSSHPISPLLTFLEGERRSALIDYSLGPLWQWRIFKIFSFE